MWGMGSNKANYVPEDCCWLVGVAGEDVGCAAWRGGGRMRGALDRRVL